MGCLMGLMGFVAGLICAGLIFVVLIGLWISYAGTHEPEAEEVACELHQQVNVH